MGVKAETVHHVVREPMDSEEEMKVTKYLRGEAADLGVLKDKKLKGQLAVREDLYGKSAVAAAKAEKWLMPSEAGFLETEGLEKTWRIKQEAIAAEVGIKNWREQYDIVLPELGPYTVDFDLSGRYMVAAGRKGHLALMDAEKLKLICEVQVRETVRDAILLHNLNFFAAAQKKYVYMYDKSGREVHCLKEHGATVKLQFLQKHFLLTSINKHGQLHYQDITTGGMVANFRTGLGRCAVMNVNRYNNVVAVGHSGGVVSMWKPTSSAPLVKILCHKGPIKAVSFHPNGHLMATAGIERKVKLWDLRKFEVLQEMPGQVEAMDFSQKGLLATSTGSFVGIFGDFSGSQRYSRYMTHSMAKGYQIQSVCFRPYLDSLAIGHSQGFSSILIPGSGEPNFDSMVANPYETLKQRNEHEVHSLLDKLPPETIMLDTTRIGTVRSTRKKEKASKEIEDEQEVAVEEAKNFSLKKKTKGRSKPSKVAKRNVRRSKMQRNHFWNRSPKRKNQ